MKKKKEDKETRYYIDIDFKTMKIIHWGYDNRHILIAQEMAKPFLQRIFLTKGQYNKFEKQLENIKQMSNLPTSFSL